MNVLKFTLSGKTAFFKKPDVNSNYYFTYGNIHKVVLLGMFGAIMGYGGYNQQVRSKEALYPEFYEKLQDIKVSIQPKCKGFKKKLQIFNNTVGYANADGNLIVREQWLEDPCWNVYLLLKGDIEEKIAERILTSKATFIPYLGKNDHMATISEVEIKELKEINLTKEYGISSLYIKDCFEARAEEEFSDIFDLDVKIEPGFRYEERLPVALEETTNQYILVPFVYTNSKVVIRTEKSEGLLIGSYDEKIIQFY
ncbi:MAG: type I-B CRISPR-associated protein Cas5b [Mobilitalea sp.]